MVYTYAMNEVDAYLDRLEAPQRAELQRIREIVRKTVPEAEEVISYMMPTFKYKDRSLLHYAAFKNHMSIFPTATPPEVLKDRLKDYRTAKGTIQFTLDNPLPEELIKEIIAVRRNQIDSK